MARTQILTQSQFEFLLYNLEDYKVYGFSRNVHAKPEEWDTLSFHTSNNAYSFTLAHPLTKQKNDIDYNVIEVRIMQKTPFPQDNFYRIEDATSVQRLKDAVKFAYMHYRDIANPIRVGDDVVSKQEYAGAGAGITR